MFESIEFASKVFVSTDTDDKEMIQNKTTDILSRPIWGGCVKTKTANLFIF